jgi:hypothetical protein
MEPLDSVSFEAGGERAAQSLAVLPGMSQTSTNALAQHFAFELSEDREHSGHSAAGGDSQVQGLRQRDEADARMFQFLHPITPKAGVLGTPACRVAGRSVTDLPQRSSRTRRSKNRPRSGALLLRRVQTTAVENVEGLVNAHKEGDPSQGVLIPSRTRLRSMPFRIHGSRGTRRGATLGRLRAGRTGKFVYTAGLEPAFSGAHRKRGAFRFQT